MVPPFPWAPILAPYRAGAGMGSRLSDLPMIQVEKQTGRKVELGKAGRSCISWALWVS